MSELGKVFLQMYHIQHTEDIRITKIHSEQRSISG